MYTWRVDIGRNTDTKSSCIVDTWIGGVCTGSTYAWNAWTEVDFIRNACVEDACIGSNSIIVTYAKVASLGGFYIGGAFTGSTYITGS